MSNRKRTRKPNSEPRSVEWLLCPDCNSTVHEVWTGTPPRATLTIEVEHSDTCPVWRADGREFALAFLPKHEEDS